MAGRTADAVLCTVCRTWSDQFVTGPGERPAVMCPRCQSLERHRVAALVLPQLAAAVGANLIVDIAPHARLSALLSDASGIDILGIDDDPAVDERQIDAQASITALPLRSESVNLIYCSHVLEHVEDDQLALSELYRVLNPGGLVYLQVPRTRTRVTEDAPEADPQERQQRFGQSDHVRLYGSDFEQRLIAPGFSVISTTVGRLIPDSVTSMIRANPSEELWLLAKGINLEDLLDSGSLLMDGLALRRIEGSEALVKRLTEERDEARTSSMQWRNDYQWLRQQLPVRVMSRLRRIVRREPR